MDINKAIRKQKKSYIRFVLSMCFIFFMLPFLLYISSKKTIFYFIYLFINEFLILMTIIIKTDSVYLKLKKTNYKLKIKSGLFSQRISIMYNKIIFVHTQNIFYKNNRVKDFKIILISKQKYRNDNMLQLEEKFFYKYSKLRKYYNKMKMFHENKIFFYAIISKGYFYKYSLLNVLYKNCVNAYFTNDALEKIKQYKGY